MMGERQRHSSFKVRRLKTASEVRRTDMSAIHVLHWLTG